MESDPKVLETLPDPSRPPITFGGTMRGFNSDDVLNRGIRGTVQIMKDGHIQWSYVSSDGSGSALYLIVHLPIGCNI